MKIVIGLTGSFASGCSYIEKHFITPEGYKRLSLSDVLKDMYKDEHSKKSPKRHELQKYGTEIRRLKGPTFLAERIVDEINSSEYDKWVVDTIKNPHEIQLLKDNFSNFFLFAIFANYDTRWKRATEIYESNQGLFNEDDERDKEETRNGKKLEYGQRVSDCCSKADIIICNDKKLENEGEDFENLQNRVKNFINLIEGGSYTPKNEDEPYMVIAAANSLRSSCMKRKVGAIIIDEGGNICSSGYNEVPHTTRPCKQESGGCFRDSKREKYVQDIKAIENDPVKQEKIIEKFKLFKILDYCRALHAEENAILNLAKSGLPTIKEATLYTTTYPCNLCANKILQIGIKKIVYLEPYPMLEAKKILKGKVEQVPFEGITPNGYFRFGGN